MDNNKVMQMAWRPKLASFLSLAERKVFCGRPHEPVHARLSEASKASFVRVRVTAESTARNAVTGGNETGFPNRSLGFLQSISRADCISNGTDENQSEFSQHAVPLTFKVPVAAACDIQFLNYLTATRDTFVKSARRYPRVDLAGGACSVTSTMSKPKLVSSEWPGLRGSSGLFMNRFAAQGHGEGPHHPDAIVKKGQMGLWPDSPVEIAGHFLSDEVTSLSAIRKQQLATTKPAERLWILQSGAW